MKALLESDPWIEKHKFRAFSLLCSMFHSFLSHAMPRTATGADPGFGQVGKLLDLVRNKN